jgi:excisionase family DNA binding protein
VRQKSTEEKIKYMNETQMKSDEFLTVADIAERLKVPVSWVYGRTRRRGAERIPHVKLGKYLRFQPSEVEKWLNGIREV